MNEKNYVHMLCMQCKKIHTIKPDYKYFLGFVLVFTSIFTFFTTTYDESMGGPPTLIFLLIYILIFALGAYLMNYHKRKIQDCPVCKGNNTLIKIDTPVAIDFIKKYDIPFPSESENFESSKIKKYPWETKS